jgi:hypothetical protein
MSKDSNVGLRAGKPSANRKEKALEALTEKKEMVRVNFELERQEHIKLKIYAARTGKTITEILREYVATIEE